MRITDYVENAVKTAVYPTHAACYYPALGLADEFGEFIGKLGPPQRGVLITVEQHEKNLKKELGDVMWYWAACIRDFNLSLDLMVQTLAGGVRADTFEEFQALCHLSSSDVAEQIGLVCGVAKKMLRDSSGELLPEKQAVVQEACTKILQMFVVICHHRDWQLQEVAQLNLDKLHSRTAAGTISYNFV